MTTTISLVFGEDLHRDEIERFKTLPNCIGVSGYKNTLNLYFKPLSRNSLLHLALVLQRDLLAAGHNVALQKSTVDSTASAHEVYHALREEAAI